MSTSIVPLRRSSESSRMVIAGAMNSSTSQKKTVWPKNSSTGAPPWARGSERKLTITQNTKPLTSRKKVSTA